MKKNNFNIGDTVSVINDTIAGKIITISNQTVQIEDEHGFIYTYAPNEIVLSNQNLYTDVTVINKDLAISKSKTKPNTVKKEQILEIDLHIHQITKSNRHLSNKQMLLRQLNFARTKINFAHKNNIKKIIFIHGIGQGVLKAELIQLLKSYTVSIDDASYKKYGKGAMEVRLYKKNSF